VPCLFTYFSVLHQKPVSGGALKKFKKEIERAEGNIVEEEMIFEISFE